LGILSLIWMVNRVKSDFLLPVSEWYRPFLAYVRHSPAPRWTATTMACPAKTSSADKVIHPASTCYQAHSWCRPSVLGWRLRKRWTSPLRRAISRARVVCGV